MSKTSKITFTKFHGLGNDFIVTNNRRLTANLSGLAQSICERYTGVGADGLLLVEKPRNSRNHARVRFFNADGSEAEMSGNGIRCAGAFLLRENRRRKSLRVETASGVKILEVLSPAAQMNKGKWNFRVTWAGPFLNPRRSLLPAGSILRRLSVIRSAQLTEFWPQRLLRWGIRTARFLSRTIPPFRGWKSPGTRTQPVVSQSDQR